jgi:PilZ domain
METRHDLRRHERTACEQTVTVLWRDARGDNKFVNARAVDISRCGMRLHMPEAPPLHSYVTLRATKLGILGNASVRYCFRTAKSKYAVGAEFTAGLEWAPKERTAV